MVSDKSGLMNADDKASVLIQTVIIIAVTVRGRYIILNRPDISAVNAVTEHAFFRVYFGRSRIYFRLHTQKRHRAVTACCIFRPDTGMIS